MVVPRVPGDAFAGTCAFHGDCLEGLASGPAHCASAAGARARRSPTTTRPGRFVVDALAHGFANLRLTLAPQAIVIGGGVAVARPWLAAAIQARMDEVLAGYLDPSRGRPRRARRRRRPARRLAARGRARLE